MIRLGVYGTLKKGNRLNYVLKDSKFLGEIEIPGFDMYSLGYYPAIERGSGSILAEIYEVSDRVLKLTDSIEGFVQENSPYNYYNRIKVDTDTFGPIYLYEFPRASELGTYIEDGIW